MKKVSQLIAGPLSLAVGEGENEVRAALIKTAGYLLNPKIPMGEERCRVFELTHLLISDQTQGTAWKVVHFYQYHFLKAEHDTYPNPMIQL